MNKEEALKFLKATGIFFDNDPEDKEDAQTINMNDVWAWALADGECVPDEELPRVAELFYRYGWCGVLYWVSERNGQCTSEFTDNNRMIEFVRNEEKIKREIPEDTKRAYERREYTINGDRK